MRTFLQNWLEFDSNMQWVGGKIARKVELRSFLILLIVKSTRGPFLWVSIFTKQAIYNPIQDEGPPPVFPVISTNASSFKPFATLT